MTEWIIYRDGSPVTDDLTDSEVLPRMHKLSPMSLDWATAHEGYAIRKAPEPGDRVEIHPATDLFMRGERYAEIVRVADDYVSVTGERSGQRFRLNHNDVMGTVKFE